MREVNFKEALAVWTRIGFLSFGGPAGQIALMHRIIVDEKKWLDEYLENRGRFILIIIVCAVVQGCVLSTEPSGSSDFEHLDKLDSVAGCYLNLGQSPPDTLDRYLSQIFWPEPEMNHKSVEYIEVFVASPERVVVSAFGQDGLVKEGEFYEGKHFKFQSGKITITNKLFGSLAYPAGNPFIGAGHTSITLGIDEQGHGKLAEKDTFAGTAFVVIPIAGRTSDTVKFIRTGESCQMR